MPSYNQTAYLEWALVSVLDQDYKHRELIVMDGGSIDGSVGIIEKHSSRLTYWQSGRDDGQAGAVNAGLSRARGDIMGWLNSDDELSPGALSYVAKFFADNPSIQFVYGDCALIDEHSNVIKVLHEPYWHAGWQRYVRNCVPQPSAFWRKGLWDRVGGLDASLHYAMDYDLWFKMSKICTLHHLDRILSRQRQHHLTKTATGKVQHEAEKKMVRERYYGKEPAILSWAMRLLYRPHRVAIKLWRDCYRREAL